MMMQEADPSLSHITSALRTRGTISTGQHTDIEMPPIKLEDVYQHGENGEVRKVSIPSDLDQHRNLTTHFLFS